ncbi:MAG: hypothetical protein E7395_05745 [Ruminococcaceae bacterium]|nr:hypothetical protein [Oscillospiraceae bacterium]
MDIVIYTGCYNEQPDFFCNFLSDCKADINVFDDYFGYRVEISVDSDRIKDVVCGICHCIIEFSLKEFVINKIYDEYHMLDTSDAVDVMQRLAGELVVSSCGLEIENILVLNEAINVESYVLFNINKLMSTVNSCVDNLCSSLAYRKKKNALINAISVYKSIFNDLYDGADVEFGNESIDSDTTFPNDIVDIINEKLSENHIFDPMTKNDFFVHNHTIKPYESKNEETDNLPKKF